MADAKKIAKLREDLEKACKAERYEKILRKADELLALDPTDEDARRCRAVALCAEIKVSRPLRFEAGWCLFDDVSSTRVEGRPREVVSSKNEPNRSRRGRDRAFR